MQASKTTSYNSYFFNIKQTQMKTSALVLLISTCLALSESMATGYVGSENVASRKSGYVHPDYKSFAAAEQEQSISQELQECANQSCGDSRCNNYSTLGASAARVTVICVFVGLRLKVLSCR